MTRRASATAVVVDQLNRRDRGAVLVVVLWVILAMSLLALSFSATIRTEVNAARNVVEQKQTYYMARAGIEYAVYEVLRTQSAFYESQQAQDMESFGAVPDVLRGAVNLNLGAGGARVEVLDESGKLNVNLAPDHLLYNLMIMVGIPGPRADVIVDSIADWVDPDDLIHEFGAESDFYQSLESPYRAKNGFIDVPEELLLIQGVTPEIYFGRKTATETGEPVELYGLQKYLTTFSNVNRINVNSAPVPVLAAIPGLDYSLAMMIEEMRFQQPFSNVTEVMEQMPGLSGEVTNFLAVLRSNIYTVNSTGFLNESEVVNRIRAVIRVDGAGPSGYSVLYWNESNTEL